MIPIPTKVAYEQYYSDDSGVEFAVRYDFNASESIEFEHIDKLTFPVEQLGWLIQALQEIQTIEENRL